MHKKRDSSAAKANFHWYFGRQKRRQGFNLSHFFEIRINEVHGMLITAKNMQMEWFFLSSITAVQIKETQLGKLILRSGKITGIGKSSLRGKRLTGCIAKPACFKLKLSNPVYSKDEESTMKQIRRQQSYCITVAWKPCGEFHTSALCFKLTPSPLKKKKKIYKKAYH